MNKKKELKNFQTWHVKEPYEDFVGPFYFKIENDKPIAAFDCKDHHSSFHNSYNQDQVCLHYRVFPSNV